MIRDKVIEVKYKYPLARIFAEICAFFAAKNCLGCGLCLRWSLDRKTADKLARTYADIVVSTGSSVAAANRIFSFSVGAKSVVILRPNIPLAKFDLNIIPEHDRIEAPNTVKIKGALAYPQDLSQKVSACKKTFNLNNDKKIAFFLGAALSDKNKYITNLEIFIEKLKDFSLQHGYKILVSTSRRSDEKIEGIIERALANFKNTEAIVYPKIGRASCRERV